MDVYNFEGMLIKSFVFPTRFYHEYEGGKLKSFKRTTVKIKVSAGTKQNWNSPTVVCNTKFTILDNDIENKIYSNFEFDDCIGCYDRLLLYMKCIESNAEDIPAVYALRGLRLPYTRISKFYLPNEPVVCSIFTEKGNIVKISFTFANPERLIEFH